MSYIIVILFAYLLGSLNPAYFIAKLKKADIRGNGSGNLGASNATVLMGWKVGVFVALHDIAKSLIAVLLARMLLPGVPQIGAVAGVAAVIGHIFPFYLKFRGGKGFASYFGMTLALNWKLALLIVALAIAITVITDYISLAAISTCLAVPTYTWLISQQTVMALILMIATLVMLYKHRENIVRICNHTEIGLRSTAKGEHRIR